MRITRTGAAFQHGYEGHGRVGAGQWRHGDDRQPALLLRLRVLLGFAHPKRHRRGAVARAVLRMPYVQRRKADALNRAFAHVPEPSFGAAASALTDRLVAMGFDE